MNCHRELPQSKGHLGETAIVSLISRKIQGLSSASFVILNAMKLQYVALQLQSFALSGGYGGRGVKFSANQAARAGARRSWAPTLFRQRDLSPLSTAM
jgi:hypothetical protein